MANLESENIEIYLKKICEDKNFASYNRYIDLLTFLVSESINGRHVKEFNIALRLYGENNTEDKSDGRVRVYMHNLRKKLDRYYKESGKCDELIFVLEKGSYNIQFKERAIESVENPTGDLTNLTTVRLGKSSAKRWGISLTAFALILITTTYFILSQEREQYCWQHYFNSDTPTLCILADQIIVHPTNANDSLYSGIIHSNIKNKSMYYDHIAANPDDSLEISQFTLYSKAIPYTIHTLTKWFAKNNRDFILTQESNYSHEFIKSSNLIYLGQFKSMDASKRIFLRGSKVFSVDNRFIYVNKDGKKKYYRAKFNDRMEVIEEYALVSYMPLNEDINALYFTSNHDIGTMAVLNSFTDTKYLKQLYKQLPSKDSYFNALFRVEGIGRTDITCTIVELEVL